MTRGHRFIALVAVGATVIAGCGSDADSLAGSDTVAHVDDQTLDATTLESLVTSGGGTPAASGEYPTEVVGGAINLWIWNTAIRAELSDRGVDAPASTAADPITVEALQTDVQAAYSALTSHELEREWTDDELAARYDSVVCMNVATTETEADGKDLIDALNGGTGFLAATETGATSGSGLGCSPPELAAEYVNGTLGEAGLTIDADVIESLQPGEAIGPWESQFGFVVLQRANLDEAAEMNRESFKGESVLVDVVAHHDIAVNPLYGFFSVRGLQPLNL